MTRFTTNSTTYIISADQEDEQMCTNKTNQYRLFDKLEILASSIGAELEPVLGVYKGKTENSYMLTTHVNVDVQMANLCSQFNQECFLKHEDEGIASLINGKGSVIQYVGDKAVFTDTQPDLDSYTQIMPDSPLQSGLFMYFEKTSRKETQQEAQEQQEAIERIQSKLAIMKKLMEEYHDNP